MQYSVHHIPTLTPISLPPLSNISNTQKSYFNSTVYNSPSMAQFVSRTYVSYISNVSREKEVYISSSANLMTWTSPALINGTSNVTMDQLLTGNGTMFLVLLMANKIEVLSSLNGVVWKPYFSENTTAAFVASAYSGSSIYLLLTSKEGNGSFMYYMQQVSSGKIVDNYSLPFEGSSSGSLSSFAGYLAVGYYSGPITNQTIMVKILSISSHKIVSTIDMPKQSNITGNLSLSTDSVGNIFLAYTTESAGTYSILVSNATFLVQSTFKKVTLLASGSSINDNPMIYLENTGGSNYSLLVVWHTATSFQNLIMVMNTTISFEQFGTLRIPSTPTSNNTDLILLIIGIVVAAILISVIAVVYTRKKNNIKH